MKPKLKFGTLQQKFCLLEVELNLHQEKYHQSLTWAQSDKDYFQHNSDWSVN